MHDYTNYIVLIKVNNFNLSPKQTTISHVKASTLVKKRDSHFPGCLNKTQISRSCFERVEQSNLLWVWLE